MSKQKEQALISIMPYPAKRVFTTFVIIITTAIFSLILINRIFGPIDLVSYHIRTTGVLLLIFLQLIIFSAEKEEDERVQMIRYRSILNIFYFAFILVIISFYFNFVGNGFGYDFDYKVLYIFVLALQLGYIAEFRKNLKRDPDWIYEKIQAPPKIKLNTNRLTIIIIGVMGLYFSGIYILKWIIPIIFDLTGVTQ
jgi:magnesium-transporting ATPase (P-type)